MKSRLDPSSRRCRCSRVIAAMAAPGRSAAHRHAAPSPSIRQIPVGNNPYQVAVSRKLHRAFVVNRGSVSVVRARLPAHRGHHPHRAR